MIFFICVAIVFILIALFGSLLALFDCALYLEEIRNILAKWDKED